MAYTEFYIQTTGNDANAGTTTADAASVTVTSASWDITADTFIGLTGTEFAAVNVGDWASIYVDGATVAVYVAQITNVGALGVSITLSTTAKYGAKPSAGATGRSCKVGGAHKSELPWAAGGFATTTVPAATRVNWKQGTYTITASRTFSALGVTSTGPLWFRGYDTTPGDCDSDPTLTRPTLSVGSTFQLTMSGVYQVWSSFNISGSVSGTLVSQSSASSQFVRVRIENTSSNAAAIALTTAGNGTVFESCWFKCPTTATTIGTVRVTGSTLTFRGCVSEGGGLAGWNVTSAATRLINCIGLSNTGSGVLATTAQLTILNSTFYGASVDGVKWSGTPGVHSFIAGNLFSNCGGAGINNASGATSAIVMRVCNAFYACSGGNEVGFGGADGTPSWFEVQEVASPFVNAPTDLTLAAAALSRQTGAPPGTVENETYTNYLSIGAVQPTSAGGTTIFSMFD